MAVLAGLTVLAITASLWATFFGWIVTADPRGEILLPFLQGFTLLSFVVVLAAIAWGLETIIGRLRAKGDGHRGWYYIVPLSALAMGLGLLWSGLLVPGWIAGVAGVLFVFRERQIASRINV